MIGIPIYGSYYDEQERSNFLLHKNDQVLFDDLTLEESGIDSNDVLTLINQCTCSGYIDMVLLFKDLWIQVYPVLDQIGTIMGVGSGVIGFGKWLMKKFKSKYKPSDILGTILASSTWNSFELANEFGLSKSDTKNLLKGLGYKWNSHTQLYCSTEKTQEVFRRLYEIKIGPPIKQECERPK